MMHASQNQPLRPGETDNFQESHFFGSPEPLKPAAGDLSGTNLPPALQCPRAASSTDPAGSTQSAPEQSAARTAAQITSLKSILKAARTAVVLAEGERRACEPRVDWPEPLPKLEPASYPGTGLDLLKFARTADWVHWIDRVAKQGECREVFSEAGTFKLATLSEPCRQAILDAIGARYLEVRKLYNPGEQEQALPPRRAMDLVLSLLFDPYSYFTQALTSREEPPGVILDRYACKVQGLLHFGDKSYGTEEYCALAARLQLELSHHLALIERIDAAARQHLAHPTSSWVKWCKAAGELLHALIPGSAAAARLDYESIVLASVGRLADAPPPDAARYLATEPFRAADFSGRIVVTGSFPQARNYFRGSDMPQADPTRVGVGDIDLLPPVPVNLLWSQHSLKHDAPWATRPIGATKFSTLAADPGVPGLHLYRTFSPIAMHVYRDRVQLVIYQIGKPEMDSLRPLVLDLEAAP